MDTDRIFTVEIPTADAPNTSGLLSLVFVPRSDTCCARAVRDGDAADDRVVDGTTSQTSTNE
jgi:hypothetical protein